MTYPATFAHTNGNGTEELHVAALRELEGAEVGGQEVAVYRLEVFEQVGVDRAPESKSTTGNVLSM